MPRGFKYLQSFHFVIRHKFRELNQGVNALSRRHLLLFQLSSCVLGFEHLKSPCTKETWTLGSCMSFSKLTQKESSYYKRVSYLRVIVCVCQGVALVSSFLEKFIEVL